MGKDIYDVVIIGGGVMGSSTAYHLMNADNRLKVCFVEKDPVYERCSSMLSMANVRVQFGLKENIQISQYTLERLKSFDEDMAVNGEKPAIGHRKEGNAAESWLQGRVVVSCKDHGALPALQARLLCGWNLRH